MTREEILAIDRYCQEHKMSYRKRLDELAIPFWRFYKAKRKYRLEDGASSSPGEFVQMVPGVFSSGKMPVRNGKRAAPAKGGTGTECFLTVELRTASGTAMRKSFNGLSGIVINAMNENLRSGDVYIFTNASRKMMIGCWAHVRRKFAEAIKERRQKESYSIIRDFKKWMDSVANIFSPKSRMAKALVYTYSLLPRLGRYVLDGRYSIDNNGIENAIRPLALGRKNYLFAGNHDAAVRAAIVYSLFSCCKAAGIDIRTWLEDTLRRLLMYFIGGLRFVYASGKCYRRLRLRHQALYEPFDINKQGADIQLLICFPASSDRYSEEKFEPFMSPLTT